MTHAVQRSRICSWGCDVALVADGVTHHASGLDPHSLGDHVQLAARMASVISLIPVHKRSGGVTCKQAWRARTDQLAE